MTIKDYTIETYSSAFALTARVCRMIEAWWQPLGGVAIDNNDKLNPKYSQAMVRYNS